MKEQGRKLGKTFFQNQNDQKDRLYVTEHTGNLPSNKLLVKVKIKTSFLEDTMDLNAHNL